MNLSGDIGVWIAAFLTLGIFSFLYRDNPIYKLCEHLFVGISAGYYVVLTYYSTLKPNLVTPLFFHSGEGRNILLIVPLLLGVLLFSRFFPRGDWLSRWPIAVILGVYPALRITGFGQSDLVQQVQGRFHIRMIAGVTAVSAPEYYPYLQTGQLQGLLGGMAGAAEYEALVKHPALAMRGMDAQSLAHLFIAFLIILGNLANPPKRDAGKRDH